MKQEAPSGVYCLERLHLTEPCNARIILVRDALPTTTEAFKQAQDFMTNKVRQDKMMGHLVPRKQCTFGPIQYKNYELIKDESIWPPLVKHVLEATKHFATLLGMEKPEEYTGVHANLYPDALSSVEKHTDKEKQLVQGEPIFSYTYIEDDNNELARDFTIWRMPKGAEHVEGKGRLADITLRSGDLLIMDGDMQEYFQHSIEKVKTGEPVAARLNFTVRKFIEKESTKRKAANQ